TATLGDKEQLLPAAVETDRPALGIGEADAVQRLKPHQLLLQKNHPDGLTRPARSLARCTNVRPNHPPASSWPDICSWISASAAGGMLRYRVFAACVGRVRQRSYPGRSAGTDGDPGIVEHQAGLVVDQAAAEVEGGSGVVIVLAGGLAGGSRVGLLKPLHG